jgi:hypothetical protein
MKGKTILFKFDNDIKRQDNTTQKQTFGVGVMYQELIRN